VILHWAAWSPAHTITRVQGLRCRVPENLGFHAMHIGDAKKVECGGDHSIVCVCFLKRKGKVKQCDKLVFLGRTDNKNDQTQMRSASAVIMICFTFVEALN
jgi:hypothetical protein